MGLDRGGARPDIARYQGFKGAWDKDLNAFVFQSKEERDRFQVETYGHVRNAFRDPDDEGTDERPPLRILEPFWEDADERRRWEKALEMCPRSAYGEMSVFAYFAAVAEVATGLGIGKPKSMPRRAMSNRERDQRLEKLRGQVQEWGGEL